MNHACSVSTLRQAIGLLFVAFHVFVSPFDMRLVQRHMNILMEPMLSQGDNSIYEKRVGSQHGQQNILLKKRSGTLPSLHIRCCSFDVPDRVNTKKRKEQRDGNVERENVEKDFEYSLGGFFLKAITPHRMTRGRANMRPCER